MSIESEKEKRQDLLQSYVKRLADGEDVETVRKEFVANFSDVEASEIMHAEQALMQSGTSYRDVQRLCDVHSALFHGTTREEKIANAEAAVSAGVAKEKAADKSSGTEETKAADAADLAAKIAVSTAAERLAPGAARADRNQAKSQLQRISKVPGHPLNVFMSEDDVIEPQLAAVSKLLEEKAERSAVKEAMQKLTSINLHYAAKGDLVYPLLKSKYNVSGPSDVMWGVDDEIRDELRALLGSGSDSIPEDEWRERAAKLVKRAQEMIYKERNILYPICLQHFTIGEWKQMSRDLQDYETCLPEKVPMWKLAETAPIWKDSPELKKPTGSGAGVTPANAGGAMAGNTTVEAVFAKTDGDEIVLPSGHLTKVQLTALLDAIPGEITFIDENDMNRYFNQNEGGKAFKRPLQALDREVYYCHPPKFEAMCRAVIAELKAGTKSSVDIWMDNKNGHAYLVRYIAVRDKTGTFIGTMEFVQNMDAAKEHFSR